MTMRESALIFLPGPPGFNAVVDERDIHPGGYTAEALDLWPDCLPGVGQDI